MHHSKSHIQIDGDGDDDDDGCDENEKGDNLMQQHRNHHHRLRRLNIQRSRTLRILTSKATRGKSLSSSYIVDWDQRPMGEGAFGHVFLATSRKTGERVALKRIPKKLASREDFQREMEALLRIQKWGGHPHICALREHFEDDDVPSSSSSTLDGIDGDDDRQKKRTTAADGGHYFLILDLGKRAMRMTRMRMMFPRSAAFHA
jgi:hypothetical protein